VNVQSYAIDVHTPLAYHLVMELIETSIFTKQVQAALSDEEYRAFQLHLIPRPDAGPVILGSGGLRKVRWQLPGRGKRGGARVIYYWRTAQNQIVLLFLYPKNVRATLTPAELKTLRGLVDDE
jgi:hypothetical protein